MPQTFEAALVMATLADSENDEAEVMDTEEVVTERSRRSSEIQRCTESPNFNYRSQSPLERRRSSTQRSHPSQRANDSQSDSPAVTPIPVANELLRQRDLCTQAEDNMLGNNNMDGVEDEDVDMGQVGTNGDGLLVPGTPPAKKPRLMYFKRCFDTTFNPSNIPGAQKVLAPDSDED